MIRIYGIDTGPGARHLRARLRTVAGVCAGLAAGSTGCLTDLERGPQGAETATETNLEPLAKGSTNGSLTIIGAPAVSFVYTRPVDGGALVYERLAPRTANHAPDAQLTIDVMVRNNQASAINVDRVRLVYGGAVALPSVTLENDVKKKCPSDEEPVLLTTDRAIAPNESCRLLLLPDQKLPLPAPSQITIEVYFVGYTDPVSVTWALQAHSNAPSEGSYRFPARAEDLPAGYYWSARSTGAGSHHRDRTDIFYAYDAGVVRWDGDSRTWSMFHSGQSGGVNSDFLAWDQPVYAMADGVVLAFENDMPDDDPDEDNVGPLANYFTIQHGGEVARYYHLQHHSLNSDLLSVGALVKEGQLLGRVGNSGTSSHPHLHIDVTKSNVGMPLLFHEIFLIDRSAGVLGTPPDLDAPFTAVEDQGLPWEDNIIWPSPFRRIDQKADNAISSVAIAHASASRAVTAARTAAGNLELVTWDLSSDGHITRKLDELAGQATEIAIAQPDVSSRVVTAFRNATGDLELISWGIGNIGNITRLDEHGAGSISKVAMSRVPIGSGVVTAFRNGAGDLGLIAWDVGAGGVISREGDATAEAITQVAIATVLTPFDGVVTASRNSAGNLVLTSWAIDAAKQITRGDDVAAGPISDVAIAQVRVGAAQDYVVTALRNSSGNLEVIAWEITATGEIVKRDEAVGGAITDVAIAQNGSSQVVTAVRDGSGDLKLIAWEVSSSGQLVREGEASGGAVSGVALSSVFASGNKPFALPAMRDGAGDLRLISWQTNLTP